jgi:hypothetical protein
MVTDASDAEKRGHAKEIVDKTDAMLSDLKMSRNSNVVYIKCGEQAGVQRRHCRGRVCVCA